MKKHLVLFSATLLLSWQGFAANSDGNAPVNDTAAEVGADHTATDSNNQTQSDQQKTDRSTTTSDKSMTNGSSTTDSSMSASDKSNEPALNEKYVIEFNKGQRSLNEDQKSKLRVFINTIRTSNTIDHVKVATWSDKPLPRKSKLSKTDRELAAARSKSIENYMQDTLGVDDVETFNMAEHSNWLARHIRSTDTELGSDFAKHNPALTMDQLQLVRDEASPMRGVIIVEAHESRKMAPSTTKGMQERTED
jgi:hypothetical protein